VLSLSPHIFSILRTSPEGDEHILSVINVTDSRCSVEIPLAEIGLNEIRWQDLLSDKQWTARDTRLYITLAPYDVLWVTPQPESLQNNGPLIK